MGRTARGSLPNLVQGGDGRWSVNVRRQSGGRWKIQLGRGLEREEAQRRYRLVVADLLDGNELPDDWQPAWVQPKANPRPRVERSSWPALLDAVRYREPADKRNRDSAAIAAATPHLPKRVGQTRPKHFERMFEEWGTRLARRTQTGYLRVIRAALDLATQRQLLSREAHATLHAALKPTTPLPVVKHSDRVADPDAVRAVLGVLGQPWHDVVVLLLLTGARPTEILSARPGDLDLDAGGNRWLVPGRHKNQHRGKDRRIPLVGQAREMLERRASGLSDADPLFPSRAGGPIHYSSLTKTLEKACSRVDASRFSSYQLRHLAVTRALHERGILHASRLAGHANPQTTLRVYAHALDSEALEAAKGLEEFFERVIAPE